MKSVHSSIFSRFSFEKLNLLFKEYNRFLLPITLAVVARVVGALFLFQFLQMGSTESYWMTVNWAVPGQNAVLRSLATQGIKWPFLFLGWDSSWYLSITTKGYVFLDQSYAFFPGLPLFSWLLNLGLNNSALSLITVSSITGVLWVPVFQLVAETYSDSHTSRRATLFYVFFPYVFLFTTVAYAEGLFILFTLLAWYFFRKQALLPSMLSLSVAVLSRPPGLLLMLPILTVILYSHIKFKEHLSSRRSYLYLALPFVTFFLWLLYSKVSIGDWFAIGTRSAWSSTPSFISLIFQSFQANSLQPWIIETGRWSYSFAWVPLLILVLLMFYPLIKMDKPLVLYSIVYLFAVLLGGLLFRFLGLFLLSFRFG